MPIASRRTSSKRPSQASTPTCCALCACRAACQACTGTTPLEHFMCAVWVDADRRKIWEQALSRLGRSPIARDIFNSVYALDEFDGYKMKLYFKLWNDAGIVPSEIDFGFFRDRATQIGAPPETLTGTQLHECARAQQSAKTPNAAARRCLSNLHPHPTHPRDRQARDASFYIDAFPREALTEQELKVWDEHIPISAQRNFGLSDEIAVPFDNLISTSRLDIVAPDFDETFMTESDAAARELDPEAHPIAPVTARIRSRSISSFEPCVRRCRSAEWLHL